MAVEENKAIVRRINEEMVSQNKLALADELFAETVVDHSALPGLPPNREGLKQLFAMFHTAFSGFHVTIEDQVAEGDKVATRKTFHGRHTGDYYGIPPTNKQVSFGVIDILRIADGKVAEGWAVVDQLGLMQQLGVIPAPNQART